MTRAVQINFDQRINSALNNQQMVILSKWIYMNLLISHSNQRRDFAEENVCLCSLHRQGSRRGASSHSLPNMSNITVYIRY